MLVQLKSQLQLGSHAVRAGNQHRVLIAVFVQTEQATEAAQTCQHLGTHSPADVLLHPLHRFIACGYIDTSLFVGF
ncbi:hypothetical protein D3C75_928130 [compost metagenome]